MKSYLKIVKEVLDKGISEDNRTGTPTRSLLGAMFKHDMQNGFPLLTTKKVAFRSVAVELEFFIQAHTDKSWLQERGCTIWDQWCNPQKVAHLHDRKEKEAQQKREHDLGPIYGKQWRNFGTGIKEKNSAVPEYDQLKKVVSELKTNPTSRRLIVSAWNPLELSEMALPPCHVLFQVHVNVMQNTLSLTWFQRSGDLMLGIPFNIASYGLLLHLLAKEGQYREGQLTGMFSNVHIYDNHIFAAEEQLYRKPYPLPQMQTQAFSSIFEWQHKDSQPEAYQHHPPIPMKVAI